MSAYFITGIGYSYYPPITDYSIGLAVWLGYLLSFIVLSVGCRFQKADGLKKEYIWTRRFAIADLFFLVWSLPMLGI